EVLKHASIHVHYGNLTATSAFQTPLPVFTTLDKNKPSTSFVVVNDIHGQKDMIASLLEKADYKQKDMVFFNGDMLSIFDNDEVRFFDGFMDTAVRMFAKEIPLYYVRGNHETRGQRATAFHDYVCPRKENLYFTVEQGPVFFICLDTGEDKPDTDIEYAGIVDYDNYRDEQVLWLKEIVASEAFKRAKYKIVVAHVQPQFDKDAWHGNLEVANKFVPILNEAGIDLMICGHLHKLVYSEPGPQMRFPLLINSNDMVVAAEANSQQLSIKVLDKEGKTTLSKIYH
ncbi:MAG: metallophosphoesterase family protein, partial [Bacteroidaceae bacterium]